MEATAISHIAICTRDMEKSLFFYRDILGMQVLADAMTDPRAGGRLHNYQQARKSRRGVSLRFGAGLKPTLTLTSHVGEEIAGAPLKLDQLGITHFSLTVPDIEALLHELLAKGVPLGGPRESFTNAQGRVRSFYMYEGVGFSAGRASIATTRRYACGIPHQGCPRRRLPEALPQRPPTS